MIASGAIARKIEILYIFLRSFAIPCTNDESSIVQASFENSIFKAHSTVKRPNLTLKQTGK
jgi:hypothetical protein